MYEMRTDAGLGELLRHLIDLTDGSTNEAYQQLDFEYRPRYTPVMRVLKTRNHSISEIRERLCVTQGAVSQTIKLMIQDGLIEKKKGEDGRHSIINLTSHGRNVSEVLSPYWESTFKAIEELESEIKMPLMSCLKRTVRSLEQKPFASRIKSVKPNTLEEKQRRVHSNAFDSRSKEYATFRPTYPTELLQSLSALATNKSLALDVGCGTGQLTTLLSPYFDQVIGIDSSSKQLEQAKQAPNVKYHHQEAEKLCIPDDSVDLISVAQAAHWFDLDNFYQEALRVAKPNAILALVSYGVPYIQDPINTTFQQGYWQDTYEYWPSERKHVETGYRDLYFPFKELRLPNVRYQKEMYVEEFIMYIKTWTSYKKAEKTQEGLKRFNSFFKRLNKVWPENEAKEVIWPISIKAARI